MSSSFIEFPIMYEEYKALCLYLLQITVGGNKAANIHLKEKRHYYTGSLFPGMAKASSFLAAYSLANNQN